VEIMKTSVVGVRLNDYQRDKLKDKGKELGLMEVEILRILADKLIEGKIQLTNTLFVDRVDLSGLKRIADKKGYSLQRLIDLVVEQLNESSE
jgi:hypothetical protein